VARCRRATVRELPVVQGAMEIKGNMLAGAQYDMAVAKKSLQSTREQGQQALQLIQASTPSPSASSGVGSRLNVVA